MKWLTLIVSGALLVACASGFERNVPEPRIYRLSAPAVEAGEQLPAELLVLRPVVAPGLRTERIASAWPGNRLDYFAGARWSGELSSVVQGSVIEALRASARLRTVEGDPALFRASHVLGVEVRRFEADYAPASGPAPVARVLMTATVGRYGDRQALQSWTVAAETPATANTLGGVTAALDDAFGKAVTEIIAHSAQAIAADLAGQPQAAAAR